MKVMRGAFALGTIVLFLLGATSVLAKSDASDAKKSTFSDIKTVWVILMENHNWTGNNAGAAFGAPDVKDNPLAPYINGELLHPRGPRREV